MPPASVSLILPAYNEEKLVQSAIEGAISTLARDFRDFEVIAVDDGSRDSTGAIMESLAKRHPQLVVIRNHVNLNVGVSIQRAFAVATKDYVVHDAMDMPLAASDIIKLIPQMEECDVLVLERSSYAGYTPWRWVCSQVNRALVKILFNPGVKDLNFTQMYRREALRQVMPLAKSPAFTTPEMIIRARRLGLRVRAIEWEYLPRTVGKGAFGRPHDILWSIYDLVRFRLVMGELFKSASKPAPPRAQPLPRSSD